MNSNDVFCLCCTISIITVSLTKYKFSDESGSEDESGNKQSTSPAKSSPKKTTAARKPAAKKKAADSDVEAGSGRHCSQPNIHVPYILVLLFLIPILLSDIISLSGDDSDFEPAAKKTAAKPAARKPAAKPAAKKTTAAKSAEPKKRKLLPKDKGEMILHAIVLIMCLRVRQLTGTNQQN